MSETSERLAKIEANQVNTEKQLDKLVSVVEQISKTQAEIALIHVKVDGVSCRIGALESNQSKLFDKVAAIDKSATSNKARIAAVSATVASIVGVALYWVKSKIV